MYTNTLKSVFFWVLCNAQYPVLNMGFPKTGSTSLHKFFQCAGLSSSHWKCGKSFCGLCIKNNVVASKPPLLGCGKTDVWTQLDVENPPSECYFPQIQATEQLHKYYPHSTWLLPRRPYQDWLRSMHHWHSMDQRIHKCLPKVSDLQALLEDHVAFIRSFNHTIIEFNISSPEPLFKAFPNIKRSCWGHRNRNKRKSGSMDSNFHIQDQANEN